MEELEINFEDYNLSKKGDFEFDKEKKILIFKNSKNKVEIVLPNAFQLKMDEQGKLIGFFMFEKNDLKTLFEDLIEETEKCLKK